MKSFSGSTFLLSLFVIFSFFAIETKANFRPPRVSEIKNCIAQKENDFGDTPTISGNSGTGLRETSAYVSQLDGLIGCVNQGLKIPNLSWRIRREWLIKRFEYYQLRQVFAQYSCYFSNSSEAEKLMAEINQNIDRRQKNTALQNVSRLHHSALRAKQCSDRAARFKNIDPEFKQGFQEISAQTDELIEKVEKLRATVRKMPE